eukprot:11802646-Alexandrium_andersonii.AAC.1
MQTGDSGARHSWEPAPRPYAHSVGESPPVAQPDPRSPRGKERPKIQTDLHVFWNQAGPLK